MSSSKTAFNPSGYQSSIFDFVLNGTGHGIVRAFAGSGKTTTLVQASKLLPVNSRAVFIAFSNAIVKELSSRLDSMAARTVHSIGFTAVKRALGNNCKVEDNKYRAIIKPLAEGLTEHLFRECTAKGAEFPNRNDVQSAINDLVNFCQVTLTEPTNRTALQAVVDHFTIELHEALTLDVLAPIVRRVLDEGVKQAKRDKLISFGDMLWLPHVLDLTPDQFDWIFIDEAQDLSTAQLELVMKMCAPKGRMLFVGDPNQAIYGFAGADCESFNRIKVRANCTEFPLSVCYRCPSSVLELAREIVPEIEARENAPAGTVETISEKDLIKSVSEGDLVLCRLTAPLVSMCLQMIANHISAKVKGRDIGKMLTGLVEKVAELRGFTFEKLAEFLDLYIKRQCERLAKVEGNEAQIERLLDRADCIKICLANYEASTVEDFCAQIESLFAHERASVTLSTVHRAKGLEEKRVFILKPERLPLVWPKQQNWERQQEINLKYVALTRALESLTFVVEGPVVAAQATLFDSPAQTVTEPQMLIAAAHPAPAVTVKQAASVTPAAQLSVIADQLATLFNQADDLINQNGLRVPGFDQSWDDDLGNALFKLRNIARANSEDQQPRILSVA